MHSSIFFFFWWRWKSVFIFWRTIEGKNCLPSLEENRFQMVFAVKHELCRTLNEKCANPITILLHENCVNWTADGRMKYGTTFNKVDDLVSPFFFFFLLGFRHCQCTECDFCGLCMVDACIEEPLAFNCFQKTKKNNYDVLLCIQWTYWR